MAILTGDRCDTRYASQVQDEERLVDQVDEEDA
jgi:hypothetical protein